MFSSLVFSSFIRPLDGMYNLFRLLNFRIFPNYLPRPVLRSVTRSKLGLMLTL